MNSAIERIALAPAIKAFEFNDLDVMDAFVFPYAPLVGQMADALTTQMAIRGGAEEANPLARRIVNNIPAWYAVKIGIGAFAALGIKRLQNDGHTNTARAVSVLATIAGAGPALSNLRTMGKI